jgi:hypothetical protein
MIPMKSSLLWSEYELSLTLCVVSYILNASSPADDAILEGSGNFRRWVLAGGRE